MNEIKSNTGREMNTEKTLKTLAVTNSAPWAGFVILLILYFVTTILVQYTIRVDGALMMFGQAVPLKSFTGAFSSVANICIIMIVMYYGDIGFITSLMILLAQFPMLIIMIVVRHNFGSIAGVGSNFLVLVAIIIIYRNNVNLRKYQMKLRDQAVTDRLTGLPNRFACLELMSDLIRKNKRFTVAVINMNNFRNINYTMGQGTGNAVLVKIANCWKDIADSGKTGTNDFITCQGGDEFALIIRDYKSEDDVIRTLRFYDEYLKNKISVDGCDYFMTANIGYAEFPGDASNGDNLLSCANAALAEAKRKPDGNHICRFTTEILNNDRTLEIERKIMRALETDTLYFVLQPQYDMEHHLSGFEALARIKDDDGTVISPVVFIPVAEKVGLVDKIDYAVFRKSAEFFGKLIEETHTDVTLSVNASVKHLMKNDFIDEVKSVLKSSGVPANQLEIEITESIMIDSMEEAVRAIAEIKKMGIKVAIDDFGTGYSSLSYLNSFPADMLKVDKEFIDKMDTNETSRKYVAAIISIGHVMNFDVISEGVEEEEQLETLKKIGCDYIQGFIWGKPMPSEDAAELVHQQMEERRVADAGM